MPAVDYMIVGQGLAGSTLAFRMLERGLRIAVYDPGGRETSSRVAAGIVNPITGRKLVKSWRIDELLPEVRALYGRFEMLLGSRFLHDTQIYKLLQTAGHQNDWLARRLDPGWLPYMSEVFHPDWKGIKARCGVGTIQQGCWLDAEAMLTAYRAYLDRNGWLVGTEFDTAALQTLPDGSVSHDGVRARAVIFCEGYRALSNPYFRGVPIAAAKGEIMTVRCPELAWLDGIINRNGFIIPLGSGRFRFGATFNRDSRTAAPTEAGKEDLQRRFTDLVELDHEVLEVRAGFRPTSSDRRPLLGRSPRHPGILMFNGLGTKGVSLAAWFSGHLLEHLVEEKPLDPEVDIRRFDLTTGSGPEKK